MTPEPVPRAQGVLHQIQARVPERGLLAPPQQQDVGGDERRQHREQPERLRPQERHGLLSRCFGRLPPAASWLRRLRRSAKRRIASTRSSSVASSSASTPAFAKGRRGARPRAARPRAAKRFRKPRSWVSTKSCSPVSASWMTTQAQVGQLHLQRIVQPHRHDLVALREVGERLRPPGRADEVGDDEHERRAGASSGTRSAGSPAGWSRDARWSSGRESIVFRMWSTCRRPLRGGITASTLLP